MYKFWLKFHWSLFLRVQLTIFQHWFRKWLGVDQATSHYLNQRWLDYRRMYASLDLNGLKYNNLISTQFYTFPDCRAWLENIWPDWNFGIEIQCSAKALEKWGQMTHTTEKYGDIGSFLGVTYVILPFVNLKFVGTWAPTAKIIGDIPDFNVLNVPKMQPRHNPGN